MKAVNLKSIPKIYQKEFSIVTLVNIKVMKCSRPFRMQALTLRIQNFYILIIQHPMKGMDFNKHPLCYASEGIIFAHQDIRLNFDTIETLRL